MEVKKDLAFNKNEDQLKQLIFRLQSKEKKTKAGGGEKKIEAQHQKGKLTARERIAHLIDPHSDFLEIGLFAGRPLIGPLPHWRGRGYRIDRNDFIDMMCNLGCRLVAIDGYAGRFVH